MLGPNASLECISSIPCLSYESRAHAQIRDVPTRPESVYDSTQGKGQLLENVFADPKGFGIAPDGRYRYELPGFTSGTAQVS